VHVSRERESCQSECVSSVLTVRQHILGYSLRENGVEDVIRDEDIIKAI